MRVLWFLVLISLALFGYDSYSRNSVNDKGIETWRIAALEWPPYAGENLPGQGEAIRQLRCLLQAESISLEVDFYPWLRARSLAGTDEYIGYFPAWPSEVETGFIATPAIMYSGIALMQRDQLESPESDKNLDQLLADRRVGLVQTYVYPSELWQSLIRHLDRVHYASTDQILMRKLSAGRDDIAITDPRVMNFYAQQEGVENVSLLKELGRLPLVLALKQNDAGRLKRIQLMRVIEAAAKGRVPCY